MNLLVELGLAGSWRCGHTLGVAYSCIVDWEGCCRRVSQQEDQPLTITEESEAMSETKDVAIKSQEKYIYHIRFSLTKSDGSPLTFKSFNEQELEDIRSCMTFSICFEPDTLSKDEVKITRILIHYDGVTKKPGLDYGYEFEGISLSGYPAPIVTFELNKEVDSDEFRKSIWTSSINIFPEKLKEKDEEPFFAEDHNGYTSIIDQEQL